MCIAYYLTQLNTCNDNNDSKIGLFFYRKGCSKQLSNVVNYNDLLDRMLSAYRVAYNTETTLIRLQSNIFVPWITDKVCSYYCLTIRLPSTRWTQIILSHRLADDFGVRVNVLFPEYDLSNGSILKWPRTPQGSIINILSQHQCNINCMRMILRCLPYLILPSLR